MNVDTTIMMILSLWYNSTVVMHALESSSVVIHALESLDIGIEIISRMIVA